MSELRLEIEAADLAYPGRVVARGLSLSIAVGKVTAILGPNGCGKSTVLRALARILRPRSGVVLLDGKDIHLQPTNQVAKRLTMLPQAPHAPDDLTVWDLAAFGRFPYRSWFGGNDAAGTDSVRQALQAVGLLDLADRPFATLSGGQRQRAWIAMALAQETHYLLLDEPTTFLDLAHQIEVMDLVRQLNVSLGKTVVLVLHDLNLAARYADHIVMLKDGRIAASGEPQAVLTDETLREVFGVEVHLVRDEHGRILICAPIRSLEPESAA